MMKSALSRVRALCAAILPLLAVASPVAAQNLDDIVRGEILTGWRSDSGAHIAAVRLELSPGWKTYWRAPGDAGIPPRFDWEASGNLRAVTPHWPVPILFDENGMRSVGYSDAVTVPLTLEPREEGAPISLAGRMQIGVCREICVPVTLELRASLPPEGRGPGSDRIRTAMANLPMSQTQAGVGSVVCQVEPIADGVRVTVTAEMPRLSNDEETVVEFADPAVWVSEPVTTRRGGRIISVAEMVPPEAAPFAMARDGVRLTVIGAGRAVDIRGCTGG